MLNQPIENHGLGIFSCVQICFWALPSRSNEDKENVKCAYNLLIFGPRGLQCQNNL